MPIDRHDFRDHRMEAAQATCDRYSPSRSWCIVPEAEKTPRFVWQALAWGAVLTVFFLAMPVIVRAVMS